MSLEIKYPDHIRVHERCGICCAWFQVGEDITALGGDQVSRSLWVCDVDTFPKDIYTYDFCLNPYCRWCKEARESVTVHNDCLRILLQGTTQVETPLYSCWETATHRSLWRGHDPLNLEVPVNFVNAIRLATTALLKAPRKSPLPPEIAGIIWEHCKTSLFARYYRALEFSISLRDGTAHHGSASLPPSLSPALGDVVAWQRGGSIELGESTTLCPFIQLTIDALGWKEIKRLEHWPAQQARHEPDNRLAYVIEDAANLSGVMVKFQSSSARLEFVQDKEQQRIKIWNTPCPPAPGQIWIFPDRQGWPRGLKALKVARVGSFHGITFFMSGYGLDAIHFHTAAEPCAQYTRDYLPSRHFARKSAWAYIPLPPTDHIAEFGLRVLRKGGDSSQNNKLPDISCLCLLFRMAKAGDIVVGPFDRPGSQKDMWLSKNPHSLIFGFDHVAMQSLGLAGACPKQIQSESPSPLAPQPLSTPPFAKALFSSGSLEGVAKATIFYEQDSGFARGVLLQYKDDSYRALGQCRLGVDPVLTKECPSCFCVLGIRREKTVKVEFSDTTDHVHDEEGWTCVPTQGTAEWWFDSQQAFVAIYNPLLFGEQPSQYWPKRPFHPG